MAAEKTGELLTGAAKSAERTFVKPFAHRAKDVTLPVAREAAAALFNDVSRPAPRPSDGSQFKFSHEDVYGLSVKGPGLNITHNALVAANRVAHALDARKGTANKRTLPSTEGHFERAKRQFSAHPPRISVKRGRVKVEPQNLDGLNRTERKRQRGRAKIIQNKLMKMEGHRCTGVESHSISGGHLAAYEGGFKRWVGSRGEHMPVAVLNVVTKPNGEGFDKNALKAPPLSLLSGIVELPPIAEGAKGSALRLHQGQLYAWGRSPEQTRPQWTPVSDAVSLGRHADGDLYVHHDGQLSHIESNGQLKPVFSNLESYQSVHVMPASIASTGNELRAVAVDHDGRILEVNKPNSAVGHSEHQSAVELMRIEGLKELIPARDGRLCGHTGDGKFVALEKDSHGRWQQLDAHSSEFADCARHIPLDAGHSWSVLKMGYDAKPNGDGLALHAVLKSSQGHSVTVVNDGGSWKPQYHAEANLLTSELGLVSARVRHDTVTNLDQNTKVGIGHDGSVCLLALGSDNWEKLLQADGKPLKGVEKVMTNASGLTFGKKLYALQNVEGNTAVHEITVGGRIKQLPGKATHNGWQTGSAPLPTPERMNAIVGQPLARGHSADLADQIVDIAADMGGSLYHLTHGGEVVKTTRENVGSQIDWGKEFQPIAKPSSQQALPPAVVGEQAFTVKQIAVHGDQGRLLALALPEGAEHGPHSLLEFVPKTHSPGEAPPADGTHMEGEWVDRKLEWTDSKGKELPEEVKATARLSTSLLGTPTIDVSKPDGSEPQRFRILQISTPAAQETNAPARNGLRLVSNFRKEARKFLKSLPGQVQRPGPTTERYKLSDVKLSGEDPRVALNRNDAIRPPIPGTRRTFLRMTKLGKTTVATPAALAKLLLPNPKNVARSVYNLGRLLQVPPMGLWRIKQDVWGRKGLQKDYEAVRNAMKDLRNLKDPIPWQNAQQEWTPPAHLESVREEANKVVESSLKNCLWTLEEIGITARVLQPDRITERSPGKLRTMQRLAAHPLNKATVNSHDALPAIKKFWQGIADPKVAKFYTESEKATVSRIGRGIELLEKNHIKLWDGRRGGLSNFTAYHGSHSIMAAAMVTSMKHFSQAVQLRAFGQTGDSTQAFQHTTPANPEEAAHQVSAHLKEIEGAQKTDRPMELARCGFSGWAGYEATVEVVNDLRKQVMSRGTKITPGSPLYDMVKNDLDIKDAKQLPKEEFRALVATKYAETVASLNPRSVYFWLMPKSVGVGVNAGSGGDFTKMLPLAKLSFGGALNLGGMRRSGVGVETLGTGDGTAPGPIVVFIQRAKGGNATAGVVGGLSPYDKTPHDKLLGKHFGGYFRGALDGMLARGRGAAFVIPRDKLHDFSQKLFDPSVEAIDLIKMGFNEGGIGLNLIEGNIGLQVGAGVNAREDFQNKARTWGPENKGQFGGSAGIGLNLTTDIFRKQLMSLRLRVAFAKGIGDEYQGNSGPRANLSLLANLNTSGVTFATGNDHDTVSSLKLANLGLDGLGLNLETGWHSTFKRTMDMVMPDAVSKDTWRTTINNARQIEGLKLPLPPGIEPRALESLDVESNEGRKTMQSVLQCWVDKLKSMEDAVCAHGRGETLTPSQQSLVKESKGVDEAAAATFMLLAERMYLQSKLAEQGIPMLQPSARLELNVPSADPTATDRHSQSKLGAVMATARKYKSEVPGADEVTKAYARLPGYNETRLVFEMDPRVVNLANKLLAEGVPREEWESRKLPIPENAPSDPHTGAIKFSYQDIKEMAENLPANYRCVAHCAKNNEVDITAHGWPVGVTLRSEVDVVEERFLAETNIREGWGGRVVRAELLPTAQEALTDTNQHMHRAFNEVGVRTMPALTTPARSPVHRDFEQVFSAGNDSGGRQRVPSPESNRAQEPQVKWDSEPSELSAQEQQEVQMLNDLFASGRSSSKVERVAPAQRRTTSDQEITELPTQNRRGGEMQRGEPISRNESGSARHSSKLGELLNPPAGGDARKTSPEASRGTGSFGAVASSQKPRVRFSEINEEFDAPRAETVHSDQKKKPALDGAGAPSGDLSGPPESKKPKKTKIQKMKSAFSHAIPHPFGKHPKKS